MSGGHWEYQQHRLSDFACDLTSEKDVVLAATGELLAQIATYLHDADYMLSGDTSTWKTRGELAALLGDALTDAAAKRARDAADDLREAIEIAERRGAPS